ncbi:Protein-disulfide isomerase [Jannaschia seosinensis]|uniref:Protein-disulfide isomerase n=1 Tax=Jannaschia seosinensis TaxID=313367 RepID=A0A0M7BA75_9RHOB|nr:DsbA family protein [Jannaschia seosinensis]CUH38565.1 Protein-disulfide isomerase [Jannaschia seosinensis]
MAGSRRDFLVLGAVLSGGYLAVRTGVSLLQREVELAFDPIGRPAGFRRMAGGATSGGGFDPFVGLGAATDDRPDPAAVAAVEADLCASLFNGWTRDSGVVPIASFSDYNCPICRVTTRRLAEADAVLDGTARITWHELPILGETSHLAARAALAADRQGAYMAFHKRLMGNPFRANQAYIDAIAGDLGLDRERFVADMKGSEVASRIARSLALREIFAFPGTPAIVVGRTVIEGDVSEAMFARVIALERRAGPPPGCGSRPAGFPSSD